MVLLRFVYFKCKSPLLCWWYCEILLCVSFHMLLILYNTHCMISNLLLNADKTKHKIFSIKAAESSICTSVSISETGSVSVIKIDDSLSMKPHIQLLVKKLKFKWSFYFRNRSCFSFKAKMRLISATFMSVLHYGDVFTMPPHAE